MRDVSWILIVAVLLATATAAPAQQARPELRVAEDLTVYAPPNWVLGNQSRDSISIHVPLPEGPRVVPGDPEVNPKPLAVTASEAGMLITVERRRDHAEALRRLAEIASERAQKPEMLTIGGWPAIEVRYRDLMPQTGEENFSDEELMTTFALTAVAVGDRVVRFDTMVAPDAPEELLEQAVSLARQLRAPRGEAERSRGELEEVRALMQSPAMPAPPAPPQPGLTEPPAGGPPGGGLPGGGPGDAAGVAVQVQTGVGELEMATNDGQNVVLAANSGYSFSSNFGATYTFGGGTPCNQTLCDGDPSLAVGNSGAIYYAWIGGSTVTTLGNGVSRSTDNGQTFPFRGMAATCPGTTSCQVADQEHIAADRANAASGGGDRVYNVWRDFAPTFSLRISCSQDGASTWTSGAAIGAGDFPRVSVGGDGFVYVAWASGGNMMLHKYSACDAGLTPQVGWPVTVSAFTNVVCPVPGLDRCNFRNILSSPKVAVDDVDPNHVYYVFATSTGAGNEDVMVFDSIDGGATFPRSVRVNSAVTGRRFMPWISSYGGIAQVSWYDRRSATAANNDRTRFYIGGAAVRGPNLAALPEVDLSGNDDAQCSTWPCATDFTSDSESCSAQPQLAGRCGGNNAVCVTSSDCPTGQICAGGRCGGNNAPCDFSTPGCPAGQTCNDGRGCPKYGDYNGNAAGAGRFYSGWASATPPASVGGASGAIRVYASADRVPSDFYVRDWNNSPAFDDGAQPSTQPVFWVTSDVWNQSTNVPAAPGPDGSILGDPPSRSGSNFVFARVARRAPAASTAPNATVTVNFLLGDFGLGSPFTPIGSETLTFTAADDILITPPHSWSVPAGASAHLCLAVQIVAPDGDTFSLPSIQGTAPGPADPLIVIDNNKAQRNLQDTVGTAGGTELIAQVRNAQAATRPFTLTVELPEDSSLAGRLDVVGGQSHDLVDGATIQLGELDPGEARWLRFRSSSLAALDHTVPLTLYEDTDPPANGFTIYVSRGSLQDVAHRNFAATEDLFLRLDAVEGLRGAQRLARRANCAVRSVARQCATAESVERRYLAHLRALVKRLDRVVDEHLDWAGSGDPFDIRAAADDLRLAVGARDVETAALAHRAFVERVDAHVSQVLIARGP